jgi:hypothetical protein
LLAIPSIFTQNSDNHFCCLISSNVLFIQPWFFVEIESKEGRKMKYRNLIPEPGTTISGFADSEKKRKRKIN